MDFTGDVRKAVLVSQTPGAGNQGLSISLYDMRNAILRDPLFLLPKMSLGFECSLFRAGQSPFPQSVTMFTHANPQEDESCSGALWHEGDLRASMWVGWSAHRCPLLKPSSGLALLSALQLGQPPVLIYLSSAKVKTEQMDQAAAVALLLIL